MITIKEQTEIEFILFLVFVFVVGIIVGTLLR